MIDTPTLVRVLKDAGFRNVALISNKKSLAKLARQLHRPELARNPLDEDAILTRGYGNPLTMPLTAVRYGSTQAALKRAQSDQPLLQRTLSQQERQLLPGGYEPGRLREVQICNVVVTSYNPTRDKRLDARFQRASSLLHQNC
ncbi:MAG: hypothetical protein QOJ56_4224 [Mycobacterium sp.]|jgi:hypothetical protein|nr:hypothetical protein [Mycobacterium sp.]